LDPNIHDTLKPRRGRVCPLSSTVFLRRIARIQDRFNLDTQKVRFELILQLKALAELAQQNAIDTHHASVDAKQNWARIAAYTSQVINSISKTFDEVQVDERLNELERMITELKQREQNTS
jgi:hypothetical protein